MPAYRDVPIVRAQLGRHAGLIGAASLIFLDREIPEILTRVRLRSVGFLTVCRPGDWPAAGPGNASLKASGSDRMSEAEG